MKNAFSLILAVTVATSIYSQKYFTKTGKINLDATSNASLERIEAVNRSATCVIDARSGNIQFAVLMKGFEFERALMQEHFNENYVESEKFPKAEFRGIISNNTDINYAKDGTYPAKVKGQLSLHGEIKEVITEGKLIIQNGKINALADFVIALKDYNISIPGLVADKVSKTAKISVACSLELFKG
jgi:polyisoprenoid-binding protein YceI